MRTALSTSNNPYNPFTQYDLWVSFDEKVCGFYTSSYLARLAKRSPELSGPDIEQIIEDTIDEIVTMDLPLIDPLTGERAHYVKISEDELKISA